jgi:hypothetical protein
MTALRFANALWVLMLHAVTLPHDHARMLHSNDIETL